MEDNVRKIIHIYTDNTDFVTNECYKDEYVYEKTMSGLVLFGLLFALQCVFMGTVSIIKKNIDNKTNIAFFILSLILSFILVITTNRNISFGYFTSIPEMFYILMILGVLGLNFKFMKDILDKTSLKKNINKCLLLACADLVNMKYMDNHHWQI